jgi:hypothetical protein
MPVIPRRDGNSVARPQPLSMSIAREDGRKRPFACSLLIAAFSAFVLVALSGAFLVGLALVGVLAAFIGGLELVRGQLWRKPALGDQVVG